ncbi:16S rRNA (uracil(1498)-N(3))-methyltransferase [Xinfangfangia sp. D13-10-4-6]|uniref:16S rRNA (uracil(1498)-N(3))-methyltransferase n=1 Tax=Pseudogemmobacter hezensis TaxID=2737662 RepID=UPI00155352C0|nr:16S rRNA (uracil(1498)-N(3))-methyltransferase [Pseudogemmobacter hezensis]NPD14650.1 16S rRNA (uracil(1498)-N(3))-methyltransferase [Pseudogemmobacter hezensis]
MAGPKVRLYVDQPLGQGQAVALTEGAANYLFAVMRLGVGAEVLLFNGQHGEWRARVAEANKRRGLLICDEQTRPQDFPPDLWLIFTPIKKERTNFIVEKAVELGVARLLPVTTRRMNAERLRLDKQQAHAVEAAEQCGATFVPRIQDLQPLDRLLADWPQGRRLYWADEVRAGADGSWPGAPGDPAAILIGPEGGFTPEERAKLDSLDFVSPVALGPRILRAETAALAAVTLWQTRFGDWI